MRFLLSITITFSFFSISATVAASILQTEWVIKDNYEIYFRGSVAQCKEQEILADKPSPSSELESLQEYYFVLVNNDAREIVSMYSEVDGSKNRVEEQLSEKPSKFEPFKDLTSVKATCFNVWGQYHFFDVLWDNDFSWLDVQLCNGSDCKISDFFLTVDDHSQLHSNITSHLLLKNPVSVNLKNSNKFELEFFPPIGPKEHGLTVAMNVNSNLAEEEVGEVQSFLMSLTSLLQYKDSNDPISQQAKDFFGVNGSETVEEIDAVLANYLPPKGRYQSYKLADSKYVLNPQIAFLSNFLTNDFKPLASIQITASKNLFLLMSDKKVIFVEQSKIKDEKPNYNFSFIDLAFENLVSNNLFVRQFLERLNVKK